MKCKYRVISCEIGIYYFYDMQSAVDFYTTNGGFFQYFNNGKWNDVEV